MVSYNRLPVDASTSSYMETVRLRNALRVLEKLKGKNKRFYGVLAEIREMGLSVVYVIIPFKSDNSLHEDVKIEVMYRKHVSSKEFTVGNVVMVSGKVSNVYVNVPEERVTIVFAINNVLTLIARNYASFIFENPEGLKKEVNNNIIERLK